MTEHEKMARTVVERWRWDCGKGIDLSFTQCELLQQRIAKALQTTSSASCTSKGEMGEMIERAAEAICLADGIDWNGVLGRREISRNRYRGLARAAEAALTSSVPSEERGGQ